MWSLEVSISLFLEVHDGSCRGFRAAASSLGTTKRVAYTCMYTVVGLCTQREVCSGRPWPVAEQLSFEFVLLRRSTVARVNQLGAYRVIGLGFVVCISFQVVVCRELGHDD